MLKGKIKEITEGVINDEVVIVLLNGLEIISIITKSSVKNLVLEKGKEVYAVIKAGNVMIAIDD